MNDLVAILNDFTSHINKSAMLMQGNPTPASTGTPQDQAGQAGAVATAGQPTVRTNETNAISTQQAPPLAMPVHKAPTSNAAPKQINFNSFNGKK